MVKIKFMTNNEIAAIVFNEVKNEYGVTAFQLYSKTRLLHIRESRQVFSQLMRKHTDMTLKEIGKLVNRDHATVMHSCKVVDADIESNQKFRKRYDRINNNITDKIYV